ncbi:MAG: patatin-like phospholipase family protein [Clostridia bacterium]|nr:patatin-like phospholipase family protein [Clostridia bacterium]
MLCNGVFSGGGVRGIGHVGAASVFEKKGYKFYRLAGTSAGAIVSALLAAGYTSGELYQIMKKVDYKCFCQEKLLNKLGLIGDMLSLVVYYGIYHTDYFQEWIETLLKSKNVYTFSDLKITEGVYKLQVTACDVSSQRLLIFPQDSVLFGIKPDSMRVSEAVKMSMSIPLFYIPAILKDAKGKAHYIADGGLLSNYPVYLVDRYMDSPKIPTFGFKFINLDGIYTKSRNVVDNIVEYCKFTLETMLGAQDNIHISKSSGDFERTVFTSVNINVNGKIKTLGAANFDITAEESEAMYQNGVIAANNFLKNWNFNEWKQKYRNCKLSLTNAGK